MSFRIPYSPPFGKVKSLLVFFLGFLFLKAVFLNLFRAMAHRVFFLLGKSLIMTI